MCVHAVLDITDGPFTLNLWLAHVVASDCNRNGFFIRMLSAGLASRTTAHMLHKAVNCDLVHRKPSRTNVSVQGGPRPIVIT